MEIGLYYYNARWYDPALGRFMQADTIVPGAGNSIAYDRYAYVLKNPINNIDPEGHYCTKASYSNSVVRDDICEQLPPPKPIEYPQPVNLYPDIENADHLTALPFESWNKEFWWGFGANNFATNPENCSRWYSRLGCQHNGLDWSMDYGTPLIWTGTKPAKVVGINNTGVYMGLQGLNIVLQVGNFYYIFGHTSGVVQGVEVGSVVMPGQEFGFSGAPLDNNGDLELSNAHLHFEIRPVNSPNIYINPLTVFSQDLLNDQYPLFYNQGNDYPVGKNPLSLGYFKYP